MPLPVRIAVIVAVGLLLTGGGVAWAVRGSAILLDLSTGAARLLCL
jgi:hypothetical protein